MLKWWCVALSYSFLDLLGKSRNGPNQANKQPHKFPTLTALGQALPP